MPKWKVVDGVERRLQRFITNLVPANSYQEHMAGDDQHLPCLGQMSMLEVELHQDLLVDSEDLSSCFNLFTLPPQWAGMMTFASSKVFGGPADQQIRSRGWL